MTLKNNEFNQFINEEISKNVASGIDINLIGKFLFGIIKEKFPNENITKNAIVLRARRQKEKQSKLKSIDKNDISFINSNREKFSSEILISNIKRANLIIKDISTRIINPFINNYFKSNNINKVSDLYGIVFETSNYNLFKRYPKNRDTSKLNKTLQNNIKKYGALDAYSMYCIITNGELMTIDGHNRLDACIDENIPVKFMICEDKGIEAYEIAESFRKHTPKDYLNSNLRDPGTKDIYIKFNEYMKDFGTKSTEWVQKLLGGYPEKDYKIIKEEFKKGNFKIINIEEANKIKEFCKYFYIQCDYSQAVIAPFIKAVQMLFSLNKMTNKKLKSLKNNAFILKGDTRFYKYPVGNHHDVLYMFQDIYNYRKSEIFSLRDKCINAWKNKMNNQRE